MVWCTQVLRHDIGEKKKVGTVSEAFPHLVLDNFTSKLGQRVANILKYLFLCPKARSHCGRRLASRAMPEREVYVHHLSAPCLHLLAFSRPSEHICCVTLRTFSSILHISVCLFTSIPWLFICACLP